MQEIFGLGMPAYVIIVVIIILISMTIHEAMHGFMAYFLGDNTAKNEGRLTLNPIKHIDPFLTIILPVLLAIVGAPIFGGAKPVPFNPHQVRYGEWGAALVAVAGPLTNLILAFVCFGISTFIDPSSLVSGVLVLATIVNLGFFAFNILPIPPLDGSRLLYALAPDFLRRLLEALEHAGLVMVFVLVLIASGPLGAVIRTIITFALDIFSAIFGVR